MREIRNNIVMFPKWRQYLEKDSFKLLKEKEYSAALDVFNELIKHGETNHKVIFGKLLCLAELEEISEAMEILERLIYTDGNTRHEYVHMYVTMLYQMNEYEQLIDVVDQLSKIEKYPKQYRLHIEQLYTLSESLKIEAAKKLKNENVTRFFSIIKSEKYIEQRHIIQSLKKLEANPTKDFYELLQNTQVHPVIKTELLIWFKSVNVSEQVEVEKLGLHTAIKTCQLWPIYKHNIYNDVLNRIENLENDNPTLIAMLKETFKRFLYVWYPLPLNHFQAEDFVVALKSIVQQSEELNDMTRNNQSAIDKLTEIIIMCDALYLSVVDG